ncbi:MAG TPA: hypothetical protein VKA21_09245 [Candidatus Binatia bacterium]|nr:hypothetical protein [Candidatus Binatia bacterium]
MRSRLERFTAALTAGLAVLILAVLALPTRDTPRVAWAASSCGNAIIEAGEQCDPPGAIQCPPGSPANAFLPCQANCSCTPPPGSLDHFHCYKTRKVPFSSRTVTLADEWASTVATVKRTARLCPPADKNTEGMVDPTAHLMCYRIKEPRQPNRDVVVRNQFGDLAVGVRGAESLCVPATKNSVPSALNLDHFKCYKARSRVRFPTQFVSIVDQFTNRTIRVGRPKLFCNAVNKNGEGIPNLNQHLSCHQARDVSGQGHPAPPSVTVADQFGSLVVSVKGSGRLLCVPSELNPTGTTSTTTSTSATTSSSTTTTTISPLCGNSSPDPGEECDPPGSITCPPGSPASAFLACQANCKCPTITTTTTTIVTTTTTTLPSCCPATRIATTSSQGTLEVSTIPAFPFPANVQTVIEVGAAPGYPDCQHSGIVPPGGFAVPAFCIPALGFTSDVQPTGCESGGADGAAVVWDAVDPSPDPRVIQLGDTSDPDGNACGTLGLGCVTGPGGAGADTRGNVNTTRGGAPVAGGAVHTQVDIPVHSITWTDADGDCPDLDGQYDPGSDTLITEFDFILSPTTGATSATFTDLNGDGCAKAGNGPNTKSGSGSPAAGPCCTVGQSTTVAATATAFTGGAPLYDITFKSITPTTISSCGLPASATSCTLTTDPCKN